MTKAASIARFFEAYGAKGDGRRAEIYLEQVAGFRETTVDAAVTRVLERWPHVSLPPVSKLSGACRELEAEQRDQAARRPPDDGTFLRKMTDEEVATCKLVRELYAEGLGWCQRTGAWVPWGEQQEYEPSAVPTREGCEAALAAVMRGDLKGDREACAWRRGKAPQSRSGMTHIAAVTKAQKAVFD